MDLWKEVKFSFKKLQNVGEIQNVERQIISVNGYKFLSED